MLSDAAIAAFFGGAVTVVTFVSVGKFVPRANTAWTSLTVSALIGMSYIWLLGFPPGQDAPQLQNVPREALMAHQIGWTIGWLAVAVVISALFATRTKSG